MLERANKIKTDTIVLGAGGHAKVLIDCLLSIDNLNIIGIIEVNKALIGTKILGIPVIGHEDEILKQRNFNIKLVNGVGSANLPIARREIFNKFKQAGFSFLNVIHRTSYIGGTVSLGEGIQVMAGSIIQPAVSIGNNTIINTHAVIEHDCQIGDHVHIAPGVVCCGGTVIGSGTHIGCGAVIREGLKIAENCMIAAGAVVVHNITANSKVGGVPAKIME